MTRYDKIVSGTGKAVATLAFCALFVAGCSKESPEHRGEQAARLEVVGIGLTDKQPQAVAPGTRAVAGSDGNTSFTDGDQMGLFLRGEKYANVDNRKVSYSKPTSAAGTWTIDGEPIMVSNPTAVASLVFPYLASAALDNIPLATGPYDVQTRDIVWKQQQVYASVSQVEVSDMKHALVRVKILLKRDDPDDQTISDRYTGTGTVSSVTLDNGTAAGSGSNAAVFTAGKLDMTAVSPASPVTGTTAGAVTDGTERTLSTDGTTADLLVLPVTTMSENLVSLKVTVDGNEITKSLPYAAPADKWEAGKCYTYTVTVKNTQVVFDKVVTTAWNGGADVPGDMEEQVAIGALKNGGIVYWIDPDDAEHYKVMSLYEPSGMTWDEAGTWCDAQGKGWIFPTQTDLTDIYNARKNSGGTSDLTASRIDRGIAGNGGTALGTDAYWSATETSAGGSDAQAVTLASGAAAATAKTARLVVRAILEWPVTGIDLSRRGTANCYIVSEAGNSYKFNATVMGNGATTPLTDCYADQKNNVKNKPITPVALVPASAFVVWSTGASLDAVVKDLKIKDGYVCFTTTGAEGGALTAGNAVIGVKDAGGNLIWSWHIWATDYDPATEDVPYTTRELLGNGVSNAGGIIATASRSLTMMGRNLGALNNTPQSPESTGMHYQWGRKDPFPPAATPTSANETTPFTSTYPTQNASGYSWTVTPGSDGKITAAGAGADGSIDYAILHPTEFITCGTNTKTYDWLNVNTIPDQRNYLWGNPNPSDKKPNVLAGSKSIYDPCPPGYRVPRQDSWTSFSTNNTAVNGAFVNATTTAKLEQGLGYSFYCNTANSVFSYYPAAGSRNSSNGRTDNTGAGTFSWSSTSDSGNITASNFSAICSGATVAPLGSNARAYGFSVRCAKE